MTTRLATRGPQHSTRGSQTSTLAVPTPPLNCSDSIKTTQQSHLYHQPRTRYNGMSIVPKQAKRPQEPSSLLLPPLGPWCSRLVAKQKHTKRRKNNWGSVISTSKGGYPVSFFLSPAETCNRRLIYSCYLIISSISFRFISVTNPAARRYVRTRASINTDTRTAQFLRKTSC